MSNVSSGIDSILNETRVFAPPAAEKVGMARWHIDSLETYRELHRQSIQDLGGFWDAQARWLHWRQPWNRVLDWNPPDAKWFVGGRINACENCVDRHVAAGHGGETALIWEGEPMPGGTPEIRRLTYADLQRETARFGNALKGLGVRKGDVVTIYMPMIPEAAYAMLACTRIGAIHSIVFGGFSPDALAGRIVDCESTFVITADEGLRGGRTIPLKGSFAGGGEILR